jgi:hypothetical protein
MSPQVVTTASLIQQKRDLQALLRGKQEEITYTRKLRLRELLKPMNIKLSKDGLTEQEKKLVRKRLSNIENQLATRFGDRAAAQH